MSIKEIKLSKEEAVKLFAQASPAGQQFLKDKFGADTFTYDPVEQIKSLEDACTVTGADEHTAVPFENPANDDQRCINAFAALIQINRAFNQNKKKQWGDNINPKWYAWWKMPAPSGSGLSFGGAVFGISHTRVPARLTLLKKDHVKILADRFPGYYEDLMTEK